MQRQNRKNGRKTGGHPRGAGHYWERETLLLVIDMLGQVQLNLVEQGVACETLRGWKRREHRGAAHRAAGYAGRVRTAWPERGRTPWMKAA